VIGVALVAMEAKVEVVAEAVVGRTTGSGAADHRDAAPSLVGTAGSVPSLDTTVDLVIDAVTGLIASTACGAKDEGCHLDVFETLVERLDSRELLRWD
jgi:hypothetical protein